MHDRFQRRNLAEAMLNDVLLAISKTNEVNRILVVTAGQSIADIAKFHQADVLMEPENCTE